MIDNTITTASRTRMAWKIAAMLMTGALACVGAGCSRDHPNRILAAECLTTWDHGCITPEQFTERADTLAEEYRTHTGFANQWGLTAIRADQGYAHLALARGADVQPGEGVTVGIIDTGIDHTHPWFDGKIVTEEFLLGALDETGDEFSHGTAVAGVIGAIRNDRFPRTSHGVAWGADLAVFAIPLGSGAGRPYAPVQLQTLASYDAEDADLFRHVLDWKNAGRTIDFLNLSFGFEGIIDSYTEQELRDYYGQTIAAMAQEDSDEKTVFVWAAGNGNADDCFFEPPHCVDNRVVARSVELIAGLTARIEELRSHMIAVVAVDGNGKIASFSNRCGIAAKWCLAAPGEDVRVAYFGPDWTTGDPGYQGIAVADGTSFAAPMVTGGLAVMKHLFRDQIPNADLAARLLATAYRSGRYADQDIYGQGLMDLGAATTPVGDAQVTMGAQVGDAGHGMRVTRLSLGGAFGDGLTRSLAGREIAAFDALGAPFWYDLSGLAHIAPRPSAVSRLRDLMDPGDERVEAEGTRLSLDRDGRSVDHGGWRLGLLQSPTHTESSLLNLAEDAATLTFVAENELEATAFLSTTAGSHEASEHGAVLAWQPSDTPFGVRIGWLGERQSLLGAEADGAFGRLSADSVVLGLEAETKFGAWRLAADTEIGLVSPRVDGGVVAGVSGVTTSAMSLRADRQLGDANRITFSLSQPPRVEHGVARLTAPTGRTKDGAVVRESVVASLVPSGRQIDAAARWQRTGVLGGEIRSEIAYSNNPGHMDTKSHVTASAGWRIAF